jgi:hypothetical protein
MDVILIHKRIIYFNLHMQKCEHNEITVTNSNRYSSKAITIQLLMATEQRRGEDRTTQQGGSRLMIRRMVSAHCPQPNSAVLFWFSHTQHVETLYTLQTCCAVLCVRTNFTLTSFFLLRLLASRTFSMRETVEKLVRRTRNNKDVINRWHEAETQYTASHLITQNVKQEYSVAASHKWLQC